MNPEEQQEPKKEWVPPEIEIIYPEDIVSCD